LIIAGVFLLFSYISIDITAHKAAIKSKIEENINATVEFDKAMVRLLPYPTITITGLQVFDKSIESYQAEDAEFITASMLKVTLSPLLLIRKQIYIKRLIIEDSVIRVRRFKDGSFDIAKLKKDTNNDNAYNKGAVALQLNKFRLRNARIRFIDEKIKDGGLDITSVKAYLNQNSRGYTFSLGGKLSKDSTFILSGATLPEQTGSRVSGTMDVAAIEVSTIKAYLPQAVTEVINNGTLEAKLDFSFAGTSASRNNGTIKGSLSSSRLVITPPSPLTHELRSPKSRANIEMSWSPEHFLFALSDINFAIEDEATHQKQFELNGKIKLTATNVEGSGRIEALIHTSPISTAYLKELVDLSAMPLGIRPTLLNLKETEGKIALKKLAVLTTLVPPAGRKTRKKKIAFKLELIDTGITHTALKQKISGLSGNVIYINGTLALLDINGRYGNGKVNFLGGSISLTGKPLTRFSLDADLDTAETLEDLKDAGLISKKLYAKGTGTIGVKLLLDGVIPGLGHNPTGDEVRKGLLMESYLDLTKSRVELENALDKDMDMPLTIKAKSHFKPGGISASKIEVKSGKSTAFVKWKGDNSQGSSQIDIKMKDFRIGDYASLTPFIFAETHAKGRQVEGVISGHFTRKKAGKGKLADYDVNIKVKDALFNTPVVANTLRDFNLTLRLKGNTGRLLMSNAKVLDTQLSAKIDVLDISQGLLDMNFVSKNFNTRDVFPPTYKPKVIKRQPFKGRGVFTVAKGKLTNISFTNFHSKIRLDHKQVILEPVTFTSHEGLVSGNIIIERDRRHPLIFSTDFKVAMAELETLFGELGAKRKVLSGRAMGDCYFEMRRGVTPGTAGVDGRFKVSSQQGRMWKLVVFNKLFSIINIVSINSLFDKGLKYDSVAGDFTIKDGVISTENLLLESNSMRLSSVASIDLTKQTIDATLAMHPLVTIDKVISSIPFAGWVITGKERSTFTIYSEMKGPLSDPAVKAVPLKSIGRKIGGIFKRLLFIPDKKNKKTKTTKDPQPSETTSEDEKR
jgi:uncharacterized protein involved in outer membrane biogenesis